jgi:hypothetical protein
MSSRAVPSRLLRLNSHKALEDIQPNSSMTVPSFGLITRLFRLSLASLAWTTSESLLTQSRVRDSRNGLFNTQAPWPTGTDHSRDQEQLTTRMEDPTDSRVLAISQSEMPKTESSASPQVMRSSWSDHQTDQTNNSSGMKEARPSSLAETHPSPFQLNSRPMELSSWSEASATETHSNCLLLQAETELSSSLQTRTSSGKLRVIQSS